LVPKRSCTPEESDGDTGGALHKTRLRREKWFGVAMLDVVPTRARIVDHGSVTDVVEHDVGEVAPLAVVGRRSQTQHEVGHAS
jgi:hypothetical protein